MNANINSTYENDNVVNVNQFFKDNDIKIKNDIGSFLKAKFNCIKQFEVDEIFQEVAFKIIKHNYLSKYSSGKSSINTWLYIISRSVTIDYMRKMYRDTIPIDQYTEPSVVEIQNYTIKIPRGLLSKRQTEVIKMIFWGDLRAVEVAEQLDISPQTVRSIKHQAIIKLRRHFGAEGERRIIS